MANTMTGQEGYNVLMQNIFAPVFFEKLAQDYGIRPSTEAEATELLAMAGKLQQIEDAYTTKQANERSSYIHQLSRSLDQHLGLKSASASPNDYSDQEIIDTAKQLAKTDTIKNAALSFQEAMRQVLAA